MPFNLNFELQRLLRLLYEHMMPACAGHTLTAEDAEGLKREINSEGQKIYLQVMTVMCRPYEQEHMRRYLDAHLIGAECLKEKLERLTDEADGQYHQLLEAFKTVISEVLQIFTYCQERFFGKAPDPKEWLTRAQVEDELHITQSTFYRKKQISNWKTKNIAGVEHYLRSSLYD